MKIHTYADATKLFEASVKNYETNHKRSDLERLKKIKSIAENILICSFFIATVAASVASIVATTAIPIYIVSSVAIGTWVGFRIVNWKKGNALDEFSSYLQAKEICDSFDDKGLLVYRLKKIQRRIEDHKNSSKFHKSVMHFMGFGQPFYLMKFLCMNDIADFSHCIDLLSKKPEK